MFKMLVGISFMSVISELLLSDGKFKKYLRAVIGIFTLLIIVEGVFGLKSIEFDDSLLREAERIADETTYSVNAEILEKFEKNIEDELKNNGIETEKVNVKCDRKMNITKIKVQLNDFNDRDKVIGLLAEKFGIDTAIIELTEGR